MKLLKLIPAAAIVLTAFTTFETKAESHCVQNKGLYVAQMYVENETSGGTKTSSDFVNPNSKCIKLSNFVDDGDEFSVYLTCIDCGGGYTYGDKHVSCKKGMTRSSASSGKTYHYTATGDTDSSGEYGYSCSANFSSYP
tara:strand:- start:336 stop:752 length:417 start_codon:yes stop_codon:yes gene_type:complete